MRYQVAWGPKAEQMLADIWLAASNRTVVTQASAWLERELGYRPLQIGESRTSSVQRVAFCPPLGVEYEVIEDDKRVVVQGVFVSL